jgi:hypothetical protein
MTEQEEKDWAAMERRADHFINSGCDHERARELAYHMMVRDRENRGSTNPLDDRRVCFECTHYDNKFKICNGVKDAHGKRVPPLRFILQRCPAFNLKGKK